MIKVVGIRFRKAGKIYYFDPSDLEIDPGQHVIVETVRGIEYGTVVLGNREIEEDDIVQPLKKVIRISTDEDDVVEAANKEKEREAFNVCKKKIFKHELDMKLIDCEYTFDNNKLLFYFTADGRIDFRELVKDLAAVFKTRIELRQIGVRDETKMIGSIGICGRTLCCHAHLSDFHPVSIKMAKEQNLSLNPTKISGVCGRLMCCLKYEEETYGELNKNLPRVGDTVTLRDRDVKAEVINTNIIRQRVKVVVRHQDGDPEIMDLKVEDIYLKGQKRRKEAPRISAEEAKELKKLEALEKEEKGDGQDQKKKRNNKKRNPRNKNNQGNNQGGNQKKDSAKGDSNKNQENKNQDNKSGDKKNRNKNRRNRNRNKNKKPGNNQQNQNKGKDGAE